MIGLVFELTIVHLTDFIEGGRALDHLAFLVMVFYLLWAGHTGFFLVCFEAADTDVPFVLGGIA